MDEKKEIKGAILYGLPGKGNTYRIFPVQTTRPSARVEGRKTIFQTIEALKDMKPVVLKFPEIEEIADW